MLKVLGPLLDNYRRNFIRKGGRKEIRFGTYDFVFHVPTPTQFDFVVLPIRTAVDLCIIILERVTDQREMEDPERTDINKMYYYAHITAPLIVGKLSENKSKTNSK